MKSIINCGFLLLVLAAASCNQKNLVEDHKVPAEGIVDALGYGMYSPYQFIIRNSEIVVMVEEVTFGSNVWVDDLTDTLPGAILNAMEGDNEGAFEAEHWRNALKSRKAKFTFEWLDGESTVSNKKVKWCFGKSVITPGKGHHATNCGCRPDSVASVVTQERPKETYSEVRIVGYEGKTLVDLASGIKEIGDNVYALSYSKHVAVVSRELHVTDRGISGSEGYKMASFKDTITTAGALPYWGSLNHLDVEGIALQKYLNLRTKSATENGERIIFVLYEFNMFEGMQKHVFILDNGFVFLAPKQ